MQCRFDPPPFQYSHLVHPDLSSLPSEIPSYLRRPFEVQETSRILVLAINVRAALGDEQIPRSRDLRSSANVRNYQPRPGRTTRRPPSHPGVGMDGQLPSSCRRPAVGLVRVLCIRQPSCYLAHGLVGAMQPVRIRLQPCHDLVFEASPPR